jgi:chromosome segregation ATPase
MHRFKTKIEDISYDFKGNLLEGLVSLLMFLSLSVMVAIFTIFILLNVFVKQSLTDNNTEISKLLTIKQNQVTELGNLDKKLKLTEKDLKDRIKTNKGLSNSLSSEKKKKNSAQESLKALDGQYKKMNKSYEVSENVNDDLALSLDMEKEQLADIQFKFKVLDEEYNLKMRQIQVLERDVDEEKVKYNALHGSYKKNLDYIEDLEREIQDLKEQMLSGSSSNTPL